MAEEEKILSIKVDYAEAIKAIGEYKTKIDEIKEAEKELKQQLKDGQISQKEYNEEMAVSKIKTQQYTESIRVLSKEVNNNLKQDKAKVGSLKGLRAELSNLTAQYDSLSAEERENKAIGGALAKQINATTKEIKDAEEATGRYYRNVGNYENAIKSAMASTNPFISAVVSIADSADGAAGMFNQMKTGLLNVTKAALAFIATPLGAILTVIAGAVALLTKGISSSEEQMNRWRIVIAPLNSVLDGLSNVITWLSDKILTLVESGGKVLGWVNGMLEKIPFLGDAIKELNEETGKRVELSKAQIAYEKAVREEIVRSAERERDISELRAKVAQKDKYTAKERIEFLDQAIAIEEEQAKKKKELAEMRLAALELEGSLTENDAEMNNKLAEAKAAVIKADTDLNNKTREMYAQRVEAINQIKAETKANEAAAAAANKAAEAAVKKTEKDVQDAAKMEEAEFKAEYERQKRLAEARLAASKSSSQEELDLKLKLNEIALNEELRQVKDDEELKLAIRAEYAAKNEALTKEFNDNQVKANQDRADKELEIEQAKLQAMSAVMGSLVGLIEAVGESSKAAAIASKVIALAQIAIDTGAAISSGIAQAAKAGPFPANLAAIATTVATVVANMAQAIKTVKSAKFSTGGDVSGEGTSTSDSIPAMLSDGESVMTAKATSMFAPILSAFNQAGGGVPIYGQQAGSRAMGEDMLAKSFAKGLAEMPAPQVAVTEIERVSNRVKVIENINRI